jgi:dethiobiotin synthetase
MIGKPPRGLFITGTSTDVGKTYVASRIARSLVRAGKRVGVYKPVASGCRDVDGTRQCDDASQLWEGAGRPGELAAVCPQKFLAPVAPHLAARREGRVVDSDLLRMGLDYWRERSEFIIVEGAGGLMSPASDDDYVADLAHEFRFPLIVVAANALGVINQTLQTLITAATWLDGLDVAGIVLNDVHPDVDRDPSSGDHEEELRRRSVPPLLAHLRWKDDLADEIDWWELGKS